MKKITTKSLVAVSALVLLSGIFYTGCQKKATVDTDTSAAEDNSKAENSYSAVFRSVNENSDTTDKARSNCPLLSFVTTDTATSPNGYPKTLTVDYGTTGCDGKTGSFKAEFTKPFHDSGCVVTVTYINYYDDGRLVSADKHTITNTGKNKSGNLVYTVNITNGKLTSSAGSITWNTTRSIEWIEGSATLEDPSDDVFLVSGTTTGTTAKGVSYTAAIDTNTPLQIASACKWVESGTLTLTPKDKDPRVINFGDTPACDDKATVTIDKVVYNITMQ